MPFTIFYMICKIVTLILVALSYREGPYQQIQIKAAFMIHYTMMSVRALDYEGTKS